MKSNHSTGALVDGKLRTINEFSDTDRKLDFRCTKCNEPLTLRLRKTRNQSHFAHKPDSNCTGAQESAYHIMAKEILKETKTLHFPEVSFKNGSDIIFLDLEANFKESKILFGWVNKEIEKLIEIYDSPKFRDYQLTSKIRDIIIPIQPKLIESKLIQFDKVEIEDNENQKSIFIGKYGFIPDAVGFKTNKQGIEKEVIIEFYYSHKVDEFKLNKIREQNLPCIEVDISKVELDKDVFKKYLANRDCKSIYLNNPKADEIISNFLKTIEEKIKEEVDKIKLEIKEKEDKISELMNLNYVQIPTSLNFGFDMEKFCPRNTGKKQEYRNTKYYSETIVKDIIDNDWNLGGDYDRHYYTERVIGITLYKKDQLSRSVKIRSDNFKNFIRDYFRKMRSTDGCKDCKFYKKIDYQNQFCGEPTAKDIKEYKKDNFIGLEDLINEVQNKTDNQEKIDGNNPVLSDKRFNPYKIENREDFFK